MSQLYLTAGVRDSRLPECVLPHDDAALVAEPLEDDASKASMYCNLTLAPVGKQTSGPSPSRRKRTKVGPARECYMCAE